MFRPINLFVFSTIALCRATAPVAIASETPGDAPARQRQSSSVDELIPWLLNEDRQLRGVAFSEVILAATGKKVLPIDPESEVDRRVIKQISAVLDEAIKRLNAPGNAVQNAGRINEVSSHVEDLLRQLLSATNGLSCDFPRTADDKIQRSGYPDLRIVELASRRVYYLDPKLYASGSRESSFRTFYYEPKTTTNKVRDDAVHLVAGFEHAPRENGHWIFTRWDLVDLAHFKVKLKAEFQGSNHDMYRPEAIVATSVGRDSVEPTKTNSTAPRSVALPEQAK